MLVSQLRGLLLKARPITIEQERIESYLSEKNQLTDVWGSEGNVQRLRWNRADLGSRLETITLEYCGKIVTFINDHSKCKTYDQAQES